MNIPEQIWLESWHWFVQNYGMPLAVLIVCVAVFIGLGVIYAGRKGIDYCFELVRKKCHRQVASAPVKPGISKQTQDELQLLGELKDYPCAVNLEALARKMKRSEEYTDAVLRRLERSGQARRSFSPCSYKYFGEITEKGKDRLYETGRLSD